MVMVSRRIVGAGGVLVARRAQLIVVKLDFGRMRIVAIRAFDAVVVHLGLNERTVHIVFVPDLTIDVVDGVGDQLGCKVIIEIASRTKRFAHRGST